MDNTLRDTILAMQQPDGSFHHPHCSTIVATSICLTLLSNADGQTTASHQERAATWLLAQKNNAWLFGTTLAETGLALEALAQYKPSLISGAALAKALQLLTQYEVHEGGPYTEPHAPKVADSIDLATTVGVDRFLHSQGVTLPALETHISSSLQTKQLHSTIIEDSALLVALMLPLVSSSDRATLGQYIDADSRETRVLVHALVGAADTTSRSSSAASSLRYTTEEQGIMNRIMDIVETSCMDLPDDMTERIHAAMRRMIAGNPDKQMSLMALYMKQALGDKGKHIADNMVAHMGLANIYFWTAFIIYDDFWDTDEAANPQLLPVANLFARHYTRFFTSILPKETGFTQYFDELMDKLDAANTWETVACRTPVHTSIFTIPEMLPAYGDYERKFEPASGHILGPLAMLYHLGYRNGDAEITHCINYFRHYLIGMQLNDDTYDWEEDMERGHLSTVVVMLLEDWKREYPERMTIDLVADKTALEHVFWFHTVARVAKKAIAHTAQSRQALYAMRSIEVKAPLEHYIDITEKIAQKALYEQAKSIEFLQTYQQ